MNTLAGRRSFGRGVLLALGATLHPWPVAADPAVPSAGEASLLATIMAGLARVESAQARFVETRTLAALDRPVASTGRLIYQRGVRFAKITDPPHAERMVVAGGTLTLAIAGTAPRRIALSSHPRLAAMIDAIRAPLAGDLALLRSDWRVSARGTPARWRLDLVPRGAALARWVRRVRIEGEGDGLRSVLTISANGDRDLLAIAPLP